MISFIIPAFNSSKTIERAIKSILEQEKTELDYEIIVVNDGGVDDLDDKMEQYRSHQKIKYFKKENSGVADTRNVGVEKASGDYIIFVDSDDYISSSLLKDIEPYINKNIDLIKWNPIFVNEEQEELKRYTPVVFDIVTGEEGFNKLFGKDNLIDCLWNYAIKKEAVLKFPSGCYHEDFAVMPKIILNSKTFVALENYEYYYVQSSNSIMRNNDKEKTRKKLQDKLIHFDNLIKETSKMNISELTKQNVAIYLTNSMLAVVAELDEQNKEYYVQELKKRKVQQYIKIRNFKQLLKRMVLGIKFRL